jgi:hypothetical protein
MDRNGFPVRGDCAGKEGSSILESPHEARAGNVGEVEVDGDCRGRGEERFDVYRVADSFETPAGQHPRESQQGIFQPIRRQELVGM